MFLQSSLLALEGKCHPIYAGSMPASGGSGQAVQAKAAKVQHVYEWQFREGVSGGRSEARRTSPTTIQHQKGQ